MGFSGTWGWEENREKIKEGQCFFPLLSVTGINLPKKSRWLSQHRDENHFCSSQCQRHLELGLRVGRELWSLWREVQSKFYKSI